MAARLSIAVNRSDVIERSVSSGKTRSPAPPTSAYFDAQKGALPE